MEELKLPRFDYHLDESYPDIVVLRRQDGAFVADFSASSATTESITAAAKEDCGNLIRAHTRLPVELESGERKRNT